MNRCLVCLWCRCVVMVIVVLMLGRLSRVVVLGCCNGFRCSIVWVMMLRVFLVLMNNCLRL